MHCRLQLKAKTKAQPQVWLSWLKWVSWFIYSYEALLVNQWSGVEGIACNPDALNACQSSGEQVNFWKKEQFSCIMDIILLPRSCRDSVSRMGIQVQILVCFSFWRLLLGLDQFNCIIVIQECHFLDSEDRSSKGDLVTVSDSHSLTDSLTDLLILRPVTNH